MKEKIKPVVNFGKEFAAGMGKCNLTVFATSGCYYLFMSLVPTVMILCCILPFTPFNLPLILRYIDEYFAESLAVILRNIANAVYSSNSATLTVSILLTLYSASASMKAIMKGIDAAYQCEHKDNIIKFSIRALVYMVLLIVTLLISLVIMVYGGRILLILQKYVANIGILKLILSKGRYGLVMLLLAVVFLFLYRLMPADKVSLKDQLPGAVFTAITWVIFSWIFTIYISVSNKFGAYGFIGTIMVTMMWMYYCLFFLLIGGYMNSFLTARKAEKEGYVLAEAGSEEGIQRSAGALAAGTAAGIAMTSLEDGDEEEEEFDEDFDESEYFEKKIEAAESADTPKESEDNAAEKSSKPKKKLPIPVIAGAAACAVAAIGAVFFFIFKKKKKKKLTPSEEKIQKAKNVLGKVKNGFGKVKGLLPKKEEK